MKRGLFSIFRISLECLILDYELTDSRQTLNSWRVLNAEWIVSDHGFGSEPVLTS